MAKSAVQYFGREQAATYDKKTEELAAIKDALHLAAQVSFLDLPYDSRILCVGAGTGAEVLALAEKNPGWRFTALDPSEAMLEVCRDKLSRKGLLDRCDFHHGYIESLPPERRYHAATSILVSQFLTERAERIAFFRQIAGHLTDGGHLLTADLARPQEDRRSQALMDFWVKMQRYSGLIEAQARESTSRWGEDLDFATPREIEEILKDGGFPAPVQVFQILFIHAWTARLAS